SPSFNPLDFNWQYLRWPVDQVSEALYTLDDNLRVVPLVADGMPKAIGKFKTRVKVREGIKFHNGDPLTAEHVAATFNEPRLGKAHAWYSHLHGILIDVTAVNPTTVDFTLSRPWGLLLEKLTFIPIVHKEFLHKKSPVMGTGPFIWSEYGVGSHITLKANPNY